MVRRRFLASAALACVPFLDRLLFDRLFPPFLRPTPHAASDDSPQYFFTITHQNIDSFQQYDSKLRQWVNLEKFGQLNREFLGNGSLLSYRLHRDTTFVQYRWVFRDEESCTRYKELFYSAEIFMTDGYRAAAITRKREQGVVSDPGHQVAG